LLGAIRTLLENIFLLVLGFVLLIKGSDLLVRSAALIARRLGVSELTIGLTLAAVGTSIPELASSVVASFKHQYGIVIGNVVGSNIANIGLVLGVGATIAAIKTREEMVGRDAYLVVFSASLFYAFILLGAISTIQAIVFLLLQIAYSVYLFETKPKLESKYHFREFVRYFFRFEYVKTLRGRISSGLENRRKKQISPTQRMIVEDSSSTPLWRDFLVLTTSFIAVILGAEFLVEQVVFFADSFGVPEALIAISLIAVGTSLPELSLTISAAKKGYGDILVGNIIGSCITNTFLILGVSGFISPLSATAATLYYTGPFMILMSVLLLVFMKSQWEISRKEGIVLIILYLAFMMPLFLGIVTFS
jgi:cation:H+ antiporter